MYSQSHTEIYSLGQDFSLSPGLLLCGGLQHCGISLETEKNLAFDTYLFINLSRLIWMFSVISISKCVLVCGSQFCQEGICNFLKDLMKPANQCKSIAV